MDPPVRKRKLGKSDLAVSPVGLGCWQFSKGRGISGQYWPNLDDRTIVDIVAISLKRGVNWFDTAELYGRGASERALAKSLEILGQKPGDVIIATKWWPALRKAKSITDTIDERLDALNPYPIDLYLIHQPFSISSVKSQMKAMAKLVEDGKIRHVGVSNFSAQKMKKAHEALQEFGVPLAVNQVRYNLLNRKIEQNGILETAKEMDITIMAYSPLAQGLLTGKYHETAKTIYGYRKYFSTFKPKGLQKSRPLIEALKNFAKMHDATPAQVALNWLINYSGKAVVAIPGATRVSHAEDNAGAMYFELSEDEMAELDRISKNI